jgi:hypothetical protein
MRQFCYLQKKAIYLHASSQCVRSSSDRNQIAENIERIYTFFKKNKAFLDPAIIAPFRIEMAAASSASAAGAKRHGLDHLCRLAGRDDALTAAVGACLDARLDLLKTRLEIVARDSSLPLEEKSSKVEETYEKVQEVNGILKRIRREQGIRYRSSEPILLIIKSLYRRIIRTLDPDEEEAVQSEVVLKRPRDSREAGKLEAVARDAEAMKTGALRSEKRARKGACVGRDEEDEEGEVRSKAAFMDAKAAALEAEERIRLMDSYPIDKATALLASPIAKKIVPFSLPHVFPSSRTGDEYEKVAAELYPLPLRFVPLMKEYESTMASAFPLPKSLCVGRIDAIAGEGVFAAEDIPPRTFVGCYSGEFVRKRAGMDPSYIFNLPDTEYCVDGIRAGNYARYFNHAEEDIANLTAEAFQYEGKIVIALFTNKEVSAGSQLLLNYGSDYNWSHVPGGKPFAFTPEMFTYNFEEGTVVEGVRKRKPKSYEFY